VRALERVLEWVLERALERPSSDEKPLQMTHWLRQWVLARVRELALERMQLKEELRHSWQDLAFEGVGDALSQGGGEWEQLAEAQLCRCVAESSLKECPKCWDHSMATHWNMKSVLNLTWGWELTHNFAAAK